MKREMENEKKWNKNKWKDESIYQIRKEIILMKKERVLHD